MCIRGAIWSLELLGHGTVSLGRTSRVKERSFSFCKLPCYIETYRSTLYFPDPKIYETLLMFDMLQLGSGISCTQVFDKEILNKWYIQLTWLQDVFPIVMMPS